MVLYYMLTNNEKTRNDIVTRCFYYIHSQIPLPISELPRKMHSLQNNNDYVHIYIYIYIDGWV